MKTKCIRHGEICFKKMSKLPKDLVESTTKEIVKGSHGNSHTFDNGKLYFKKVDDYVFGYFVAKNTTLFHAEHGRDGKAKLLNGIYELRKQNEWINSELRQVID